MKKISLILLDIFLIFTVGFSFVIWFWYVYPYKPLVINEEPLKILNENKIVSPGGILLYEVNFTKNTDKKAVIYRRFVDGIIYNVPPVYPLNTPGEYKTKTSVSIPSGLPVGYYTLHSRTCYQMNPIREICVEYSTEEFEVK
jgi:hypothetical protein